MGRGKTEVMDISTVTERADVLRLLAEVDQREQEVELKLQEALLRAFQPEPKTVALNAARSQLEVVGEDSKELLETIATAAAVADSVSSKVREIDLSRSRLQQVAERVEKIASSKQAAEELEMALDHGAFEEAAAIVRRVLGAVGPPHLVEGIKAFEKAVDEKLLDAEAAGNVADIGRFARMGAALGPERAAAGIARYAKHLRGVIAKSARTHRERLVAAEGKGEKHAHLAALSAILQTVAGVAGEQKPVVLEHFGGAGHLVLLEELQLECDEHACAVLRSYTEKKRLPELCRVASAATNRASVQGTPPRGRKEEPGLDAKATNELLDELAAISERASGYEDYMATHRASAEEAQAEEARPEADDEEEGHAPPRPKGPPPKPARRTSGLRETMQESIGQYITLEAYLVSHNIGMAVSRDALPKIDDASNEEGVLPASSVVDEVFFVLQQALRRAISFANEDAVSAVLNHVMSVVEGDYVGYLGEMIDLHRETLLSSVGDTLAREASSLLTAAASAAAAAAAAAGKKKAADAAAAAGKLAAGESDCAVPSFVIYLNDVQISIDYVGKLATSIGDALRRSHPAAKQAEGGRGGRQRTRKWEAALEEMGAAEQLSRLQDKALSSFFDRLYPRLKAGADAFKEMDFVADDAKLAQWGADDPWAAAFVAEMHAILVPLRPQLTPPNYDRVVLLAAQSMAERLQKQIGELHSFSAEGALQLEKDVRTLGAGFEDLTPDRLPTHRGEGVRAKLARLGNIASILAISGVDDLEDYELLSEAGGKNGKKLGVSEAAKLLKRRVDFPKAELQQLRARAGR